MIPAVIDIILTGALFLIPSVTYSAIQLKTGNRNAKRRTITIALLGWMAGCAMGALSHSSQMSSADSSPTAWSGMGYFMHAVLLGNVTSIVFIIVIHVFYLRKDN